MKIIPSVIHNVTSNAERKVFERLAALDIGQGWTAFHSLNVSEHDYKQWAELDFVISGPGGIYVLEVKGGRISCEDGIWTFTDRFGVQHRKSEGPFKQAETGMYALRDKLGGRFGNDRIRDVKMGWGVIFPDINFHITSPEMPGKTICDERSFRSSDTFRRYLLRLIKYWKEKGRRVPDLSPDSAVLNDIARYLRPSFDVVPSLRNRLDEIHQQIVQLTEDQYRFLDSIEDTDRIICSGGAGTGKSFLAVESARREMAKGATVLFVVKGEIFAAYVRAQLEHPDFRVFTMEELAGYSSSGRTVSGDVLVVDEGQDLLSLENIDIFDGILDGGMEEGRWRWFMDENSQAGVYGCFDKDAFAYISDASAVHMTLKYNCRNTEQIVNQTELSTGAYIGITEIKGKGPPVMYKQVSDNKDGASRLAEQLNTWIVDGNDLSDIVILSPVSFEESLVGELPQKWLRHVRVFGTDNAMDSGVGHLLFSTILDFKGLERRFVMLVDTQKLDDSEHSISLLYVAMTRAHAGLWVAISEGFGKLLKKLQKENARRIMGSRQVSS